MAVQSVNKSISGVRWNADESEELLKLYKEILGQNPTIKAKGQTICKQIAMRFSTNRTWHAIQQKIKKIPKTPSNISKVIAPGSKSKSQPDAINKQLNKQAPIACQDNVANKTTQVTRGNKPITIISAKAKISPQETAKQEKINELIKAISKIHKPVVADGTRVFYQKKLNFFHASMKGLIFGFNILAEEKFKIKFQNDDPVLNGELFKLAVQAFVEQENTVNSSALQGLSSGAIGKIIQTCKEVELLRNKTPI